MRALLIAVAAVVTVGLAGCNAAPQPDSAPPRQSTVPFAGLDNPSDLAVDAEGTVYVVDAGRIVMADAEGTQTVLPYEHARLLPGPDNAVWVVTGDSIVELPAGESLPRPQLGMRGQELAMDNAHNLYGVTGGGIAPGGACCVPITVVESTPQGVTELPFDDVTGLDGVAVDGAGAVYVGDRAHHRVLKWTPGSAAPVTLPLNGLSDVSDIAVDAAGTVYVTDAARVLTLAAGSDQPAVLPLDGLRRPTKVAVNAQTVYVLDSATKTVVRWELSE